MIRIENLYKRFGRNEVLKGVDLNIPEGGIYAVLGPNGSGKTTLIKSVLGLVIPNKGSIKVLDRPVKGQWKYREEINYLRHLWRLTQAEGESKRFARYCLVGISGVLVNLGILTLFTEIIGLFYAVSAIIAIEASIINNFIC